MIWRVLVGLAFLVILGVVGIAAAIQADQKDVDEKRRVDW